MWLTGNKFLLETEGICSFKGCKICTVEHFEQRKLKNTKCNPFPHLNLYYVDTNHKILITRDHIRPLSKGGSDTLDNLQTMCIDCNQMKGNSI